MPQTTHRGLCHCLSALDDLHEVSNRLEVFVLIPLHDRVVVPGRHSTELLLRTGLPFEIPLGMCELYETVLFGVHHEQRVMHATRLRKQVTPADLILIEEARVNGSHWFTLLLGWTPDFVSRR